MIRSPFLLRLLHELLQPLEQGGDRRHLIGGEPATHVTGQQDVVACRLLELADPPEFLELSDRAFGPGHGLLREGSFSEVFDLPVKPVELLPHFRNRCRPQFSFQFLLLSLALRDGLLFGLARGVGIMAFLRD